MTIHCRSRKTRERERFVVIYDENEEGTAKFLNRCGIFFYFFLRLTSFMILCYGMWGDRLLSVLRSRGAICLLPSYDLRANIQLSTIALI